MAKSFKLFKFLNLRTSNPIPSQFTSSRTTEVFPLVHA